MRANTTTINGTIPSNTSMANEDVPTSPLKYLVFISQRNRMWILLTFLFSFSGIITENFIPYSTKGLVDAAAAYLKRPASGTQTAWIWAGVFFGLFFVSELLARCSGMTGMKAVTQVKRNSYRLFLRFLSNAQYNDEPGVVAHKVVLISEGVEHLLHVMFWSGASLLLRVIISLGLAFSVNPVLFAICFAWMLLHLISAYFIARFKQKFTMLHAQATGAFQGGLVNFCRSLIYNPGSMINRLSEEMYQLYELVDLRTTRHKLDWKITEGIKVLYNLIHSTFTILTIIVVLVLWQDKLLTEGDIAMIVLIIRNIQQALSQCTGTAIILTNHFGEMKEGLQYMHRKGPQALQAPKVIW
jgi:ABC-type multidrug transport system fused ATPase/permease subunit